MSSTVIRIENVGKRFRKTNVDGVSFLAGLLGNVGLGRRQRSGAETKPDLDSNYFWALRDLSLEVEAGDVLGIIGPNGAGKSTLLKILSQITAPTTGMVELTGRVSSLLEVGTGFHPELSGRENVYFNGAILGMHKAEIDRKFDEIVAFSGVESFIDMPVKRYSSGMSARLAFAVAAHLDAEIMIIDEVLSVGDYEFRRKCLNKMGDVAKSGRTVLFVSHNLSAIRGLCNRCISLQAGRIKIDSRDVGHVIKEYYSDYQPTLGGQWENHNPPQDADSSGFVPTALYLTDQNGRLIDGPTGADRPITVHIKFRLREFIHDLSVGFCLFDEEQNILFWSYNTDSLSYDPRALHEGDNHISCDIPGNILNDGKYTLRLIAGIQRERPLYHRNESKIGIELIVDTHRDRSGYWQERRPTAIAPVLPWTSE